MAEDESAPLPPPTPKSADPRKKELARELWERLARSRPGPDNKDLIYLARFVPLLANGAIKTLFARKLNLEELKELIQHVPKARDIAIKLVLQLDAETVSEEDLRFIVTHSNSADVAKTLLKRFPGDANLVLIERSVEELKGAVEKVRQQELTKNVLREIDRKL